MNTQSIKEFFTVRNTMITLLIISIFVLFCPNYILRSGGINIWGNKVGNGEYSVSNVGILQMYGDLYYEVAGDAGDPTIDDWIDAPSYAKTIIVCPCLFFLIPILMIVALVSLKNKIKAMKITNAVLAAINLIAIYRFTNVFSLAEGLGSLLNLSIKTTIWFKLYIVLTVIITVIALLLFFNKLVLNSRLFINGVENNISEQPVFDVNSSVTLTGECCNKCGKPIVKTSNFCIYCGAPTVNKDVEVPSTSKLRGIESIEKKESSYTEYRPTNTEYKPTNNDSNGFFKAPPSL